MPTYFRRDDYVQMAIGFAVPNTAVTYYTQPSLALATLYANGDGTGGPIPNPQYSDGFGHVIAYALPGLYTITYSGPQIQTLTLPDQLIGGGGGGSDLTPFAGVPAGVVDGVNRVFTLTNAGVPLGANPTQADVWLNFPLVPDVGYTLTGTTVVYAVAPQPTTGGVAGDTIWAQGYTLA